MYCDEKFSVVRVANFNFFPEFLSAGTFDRNSYTFDADDKI